MSGLSTAQVRVLMAARKATDEGRGLTPPLGPAGRPFKFLSNSELLEVRANELPHVYWITDKGCKELARILEEPVPTTTHNMVTRHSPHPTDPSLLLCGRPIVRADWNRERTDICDIGHQVNCPDCRTVINFCRRCIAPGSYALARSA